MVKLTDMQIDAAEERGRQVLAEGLRARTASFDAASGRIVVELENGCAYVFPPALVQYLHDAPAADLGLVEVDGFGLNLHWPRLDVDLSVRALVGGVFGTRRWMASQFARIGGSTTSPAKVRAARENGAKGGRPRKSA
ncbi:DUF2442 domain-containing protein [Aliihoeflea sp. 2WW]|uniref:DUF2442 domain-containing protein n=1 Tax=Aliihoeflea sp. 2WW TaxID=1381123 RepID=UPI0004658FAE|nr:DUF2442 domain-containing protein [Aliihoeflea sp. 2WW]